MRKKLVIIVLFSLSGSRSFSQPILDSIHPLFRGELNINEIRKKYEHYGNPKNSGSKVILNIFHSNNLFIQRSADNKNVPIELFELSDQINKSKFSSLPGYVTVFDSTGIVVTAAGINHINANEYEFRVLQNIKKEIIAWRSIKLFCQNWTFFVRDGVEQTENAYLGEFRTTLGNSITIEVRNRNDTLEIYSISAIWVNRLPPVIATFSNQEIPVFLNVLRRQWIKDVIPIGNYYGNINSSLEDSMVSRRTKFGSDENSIIFYLNDKVKSKEIIEYNLISGTKESGWKGNDFDLNLVWLKNLSPGKHKLHLRYSLQRHNVSEYVFSIEPAWHQTVIFKIAATIVTIGLIGFVVLLFRSNQQKRNLEAAELKKQQLQTELKSIHSQFNPHFVFNALSSIQALITKNDLEGANIYLSEFSSMLRDSLKNSGKEMVSLFLEIKMLESYLKLEQLRFGFNYSIKFDESIDKNAVEIPALLLQPLIENAVKHGIAPRYNNGVLGIHFKKSFHDLIVIISDNGPGYDTSKISGGYGLKLTGDRVELLNKMLTDQSIGLSANSSSKGTDVKIFFKNWLS